MSYDPEDLSSPETHNLEDLYEKLVARRNKLDPKTHIHYFPDENGRYDTLKLGYVPDQDPVETKKKENEIKRRKQAILLEDWHKYDYYSQFPKISEGWMKFAGRIDEYHRKGKTYFGIQSLDRFDYRDVSYEWWVQEYERPNKPCLISGFSEDWKINSWTYESMKKGFLRDEKMKVGKDSAGYRIGYEMKDYLHYVNTQQDDSPIYLFESQLAANANVSQIFKTYERPAWFNKDLFDYCNKDRRPPHRWFCVGPERSGTTVHFDPLNTNAWNTVIAGCKLWILFPPGTPEEIVKGKMFQTSPPLDPDVEDEAIGWYHRVYPKLREWIMKNDNKYGLIEAIQYPGETIFVGGGWWHAVLNINSDTMAVTQNYVNMTNFPAVWRDMRIERKHTAQRWLKNLRVRFPKAYRLALKLDKKDGFRPKFTRFPQHCPKPASEMTEEELDNDAEIAATASRWGESDLPFAYSGWEGMSGGDDSSTDSESSSSDDDSDEETTSTASCLSDGIVTKKNKNGPILNPADVPAYVRQEATWTIQEARKLADPEYDTFLAGFTEMGDQLRLLHKIVAPIKRRKQPEWAARHWSEYKHYLSLPALRYALVKWGGEIERRYLQSNVNPTIHSTLLTEDVISSDNLQQYIFSTKAKALGYSTSGFSSLPRLHYKDMDYTSFQEQFEKPQVSCMIDGMAEDWPMRTFTAHSLSVGKYKDALLKVGKDTDGYRLTMKMKHYLQYMATTRDDHPLYLFESQLEIIPSIAEIQQDYVRPQFFERDLFDLLPFNRRPPQRWLCVGPQGSGTTMHTDPISTNAWNTLLHGRKYWLVMSANTPNDIADGSRFMASSDGSVLPDIHSSPLGWFLHVVPKIRGFIAASNGEYSMQEIIQYPGQTIFVGGNQHHAVLNLDATLAITQNYVNESNFDSVWKELRRKRKHMRVRWFQALQKEHPELAQRGAEADRLAGFQMTFSKGSLRRKTRREQRRNRARELRQQISIFRDQLDLSQNVDWEAKLPEKLKIAKKMSDETYHTSDEESSGVWDSSTCSDDSDDESEEKGEQ